MKKCRLMTIVCGALALLASASLAADSEMILQNGKWVKAAPPAPGTPAGEIAAIRLLVERHKARDAIKAVEKFLLEHGDDPLCEKALMLAGQADFDRGHYYQAFEWYDKQLTRFPSGEYFERALVREYDLAEAFLKGKKRLVFYIFWLPAEDDGLKIMEKVAEQAPGTAIAEKALLRIAQYHLDKKEHYDAALAYDHYLALFPKAEKAQFAMLRAARAMYSAYRGPEFDEVPVIDAEQRFKEYAQRYPVSAGQEGVNEMLRLIHAGRGQRYFVAAKMYERTLHPDAAIFYYKLAIKDYSDTEWANRSRTELTRLGVKSDAAPVTGGVEVPVRTATQPAAPPAHSGKRHGGDKL